MRNMTKLHVSREITVENTENCKEKKKYVKETKKTKSNYLAGDVEITVVVLNAAGVI